MTDFDPSTRHELYTLMLPKWIRQRDVMAGEDRVKDQREKYLPKLSGQQSITTGFKRSTAVSSYEPYLARASFLNASGRTRDGLVGAITRKKPDLNWPESDVALLDSVGMSLESFEELTNEVLDEVVGVGRYGHLVDLPAESVSNPLPFVSTYSPENITDWEIGLVVTKENEGQKRPIRVNLLERTRKFKEDGKELEQYRVLNLGQPQPATDIEMKMQVEEFLALFGLVVEDFADGAIYFQEVWVEVETAEEGETQFVREELIVPRAAGGVILHEIPFTFFNANTIRPKPDKPTLLDLVVLNLSHYRNSADLEHGLHFTALPQAWVTGFKFDGDLFIGSGVAWVTEEPNAKAGYLEFTGEGLGAIKSEMADKEKRMASMGARLLESQGPESGAEAMGTVQLRQAGEKSVLSRLSTAVSIGLSSTLKFLARFRGQSEEVGIVLNQDFGVDGLTPAMMLALMQQVNEGMMSWDNYVFNLKRGEMYPDDWDKDQEAAAIIAGRPGSTLNDVMGESDDPAEGRANSSHNSDHEDEDEDEDEEES